MNIVSPDVEPFLRVQWDVNIVVLVTFDMLPVNFDWESFDSVAEVPDKVNVRGRGFGVPVLGDCQHCLLAI